MPNDWLFTDAELRDTPSRRDAMNPREELLARRRACDCIETMAKALDLPKLAQISATNYLHRFYMRQSLVRYDKYLVAAACVLLSAKVEEAPKKIGYIAREYIAVRKAVETEEAFAIQKHDLQVIGGQIISMEGVLLHTLTYELTISHPYKFINEKVDRVVRLQRLSNDETKRLRNQIKQVSWSFLNDSAYTPACLRLGSSELAAGAVYLAGLYENYVPEELCTTEGAPWWEVLSTPFQTLQDAAICLLAAYTQPYIDTHVLPAALATLVHRFHPPPIAESPNDPAALIEATCADSAQSDVSVASPVGSTLSSPQDNSLNRSPLGLHSLDENATPPRSHSTTHVDTNGIIFPAWVLDRPHVQVSFDCCIGC